MEQGMTEIELSNIKAEPNTAEWRAQFMVEAWECRFPDVLTDSGRYLLYNFILDAIDDVEEQLRDAAIRQLRDEVLKVNYSERLLIANQRVEKLRAALLEIREEPNRIGMKADEMDVEAWIDAEHALAQDDADAEKP